MGKGAFIYDAANRATAAIPKSHHYKVSMIKFAQMLTDWAVRENEDTACETLAQGLER